MIRLTGVHTERGVLILSLDLMPAQTPDGLPGKKRRESPEIPARKWRRAEANPAQPRTETWGRSGHQGERHVAGEILGGIGHGVLAIELPQRFGRRALQSQQVGP